MDSQTFGLDKGGENDNWAARFCTNLWFTNVLNGPYQIVLNSSNLRWVLIDQNENEGEL